MFQTNLYAQICIKKVLGVPKNSAVLTCDDVAIAILVAVFVLLSSFPGRRLSFCQSLNVHMYKGMYMYAHTQDHTKIVNC